MMTFNLSEAAARGDLATALWTSESSIYGRFGFGNAAQAFDMKLERSAISFAREGAPPGRVRLVEAEEARKIIPEFYERVRLARPGFHSRSAVWWNEEHFYDPEHRRSGQTARRWVVYETPDGVDGYTSYRQKMRFVDGIPRGKVSFDEIVAGSPEGEEALWRYLVGIDLVHEIEGENTDPAASLRWIVTDGRRVRARLRSSIRTSCV